MHIIIALAAEIVYMHGCLGACVCLSFLKASRIATRANVNLRQHDKREEREKERARAREVKLLERLCGIRIHLLKVERIRAVCCLGQAKAGGRDMCLATTRRI